MTTISTSIDTVRTWAQPLRAALMALVVVALLAGVFIIGRVSAPSTTVSPAQTHLQVPAVSAAGGAACNPSSTLGDCMLNGPTLVVPTAAGIPVLVAVERERAGRVPVTTLWDNFAVTGRVSSSELVGRSAELALLEDALAGAGSTATTVLVSGEPGIGKSRLVAELCNRAAAAGWLVALGGCSPVTGHDLPYGAVVSVLRSLAREVGDDALEPALRALGVSGVASVPARPDAGELGRTWLFETILEQVAAVSGGTGVVLVVEDIQWADHADAGCRRSSHAQPGRAHRSARVHVSV